MVEDWQVIASRIKENIHNQQSLLSQFPADAATVITRNIVLSLSANCTCTSRKTDKGQSSGGQILAAATTANAGGEEHSGVRGISNMRSFDYSKNMQPSAPIDIQSKPFSVNLDTDADIEWVMQAINYGLTMPLQYWNIVAHCVHIYCNWLNCLLPADALAASGPIRLPRAVVQNPALYASKILFSLCRFFTPRNNESFQGEDSIHIFSLLNARPAELPDNGCVGPVADIIKKERSLLDATSGTAPVVQATADFENWSLETYLPLATSIVRQIEAVVYRSKILTPAIWSCLLEFGLAVNFSVLSLPPPLPWPPSPPSTTPALIAVSGVGGGGANHAIASTTNAPTTTGAISSPATNNQSAPVPLAQPFSQPGVRGALQLDCLLLSMLSRIWFRGTVKQFPDLGYWEGLQWLFQLSRHRISTVNHWSRQLGVFTFNILCQHLTAISLPPAVTVAKGGVTHGNADAVLVRLPDMSVYHNFSTQNLLSEIRPEIIQEYWFRLLHLFGNPVDICHPSLVTHTAVFEQFRHSQGASRCRITAVFLPTIFHQAIRSLAMVVDLFLGISPSLSLLPTFLGVPTDLYGPIDVTEHFRYASIRTPEVFSSAEPNKSSELSQEEEFQQAGHAAMSEAIVLARQTNSDHLPHHHSRPTKEAAPQQPTVVTDALALPDTHRQPFTKIAQCVGLPSQAIDAQELAAAWMEPHAMVTVFYNRPNVNSILKLFGSWLFEAASSGTSASTEGMIVSERTLRVDPASFQVGRAEAVACLCRIFIYAKNDQVSLEQLTRFYVCLIRALSVDPVYEFQLSTVLVHCLDLLRCDLRAVHVMLPYLFTACRWVFRKQFIVRPEYISMALVRRAALHQMISMVCLPNQLEGLTFSDISPHITSHADQLTAKKLRIDVASLLLELLGQETDSQNLRMILSAAFTLSQTLSGPELPSENNTRSFRSSALDDASDFHGLLLEKVYSNLVERWRNDMAVSSFALEVLSGLSQSCVTRPNPDACKNCVRSICQFIASQCKREQKDHTRPVHNVIIHAYHCLASWLVAHASVMLSDPAILGSVIETTKLCIFGVASQATIVGGASGNSQAPEQAFPAPSKRVSEAAEQLLSILLSSVGNFPTSSGLDSTDARLTERHLVEMLARRKTQDKSRRQAPTSPHHRFRYFWDNASLLMGILEEPTNGTTTAGSTDPGTNRNGAVPQSFVDPPSVLVVLRGDTFGPQVWSCKPRFLPRTPPTSLLAVNSAAVSQEKTLLQPPVSFLESVYAVDAPVRRFSIKPSESFFMPRSKHNIPLVQADKVIPSLEGICPVGTRARSEVDLLKSFINKEVERDADIHRKIKERRRKNTIVYKCDPQKTVTNSTSAHTLLSHLGYVPVNRLLSAPSYRRSFTMPTANSANQAVPNPNSSGSALRVPDLLCDLTPIASEASDFRDRLDTFDSAILRTTSTLLIFYVRKGQTTLSSVISNMASWSQFPKQFASFVRSLGWPVDCSKHYGWAANVSSKTHVDNGRISSFDYANSSSAKRVSPPDGSDYLMYWADVAVEFAAVCPSNRTEFRSVQASTINETQSENSEAPGKVALLWLERWDDALWSTGDRNPLQVSICDQFACTDLILVHPLQNGLFRIGIVSEAAFEAGPLFTGLVASPRCLGNLVRSTVVNIARRRQLISDSLQPPPVRRLNRFKEIACNVTAVPKGISIVPPVIPNSVRASHAVSTVELIRWSTE